MDFTFKVVGSTSTSATSAIVRAVDDPAERLDPGSSITAVVADRVRQARRQADLSQAELAERMASRGLPWTRSTVINLERRSGGGRGRGAGGRGSIGLHEWLALADVLRVPPAWLLVGPTDRDAGGDPWTVPLWIMGRGVDEVREPLSPAGRAYREYLKVVVHMDQLVEHFDSMQSRRFTDSLRPSGALVPPDSEEDERELLRTMAFFLTKFSTWKMRPPAIPSRVRSRADELGVELPDATGSD
ncbi:hypothetical protein GCM10009613_55050 [Pseudonocardia kongjuensis]|uniref:HTH cro/C1-type domain-containing protein n=1 Tax=Pseudonocardia kongjuensis TaxID=102227 RepID=A0ABN1Y6P3_9PSEU